MRHYRARLLAAVTGLCAAVSSCVNTPFYVDTLYGVDIPMQLRAGVPVLLTDDNGCNNSPGSCELCQPVVLDSFTALTAGKPVSPGDSGVSRECVELYAAAGVDDATSNYVSRLRLRELPMVRTSAEDANWQWQVSGAEGAVDPQIVLVATC